jgi:hypothetical protein
LAVVPYPAQAEVTITATEMIIRLEVQSMPAPQPALRYLLLPELKELQPGNPIQNYLVCFTDKSFSDLEAIIRREKFLNLPLKDLPAAQVLDLSGPLEQRIDRAARLDKPDWQVLLKVKTDGIGLILPDLQQVRGLATVLKVRFRAEAALRRFDDGIRTAKSMFAMARHAAEHPTLIGALIGVAIVNVAIGPLEEMIEQPGCPNLYWALTNLPSPMISLAPAMNGERMMIDTELHDLDDTAPMSAAQLEKVIAHIEYLRKLEPASKLPNGVRGWVDLRLKDKEGMAAPQRRLIEYGIPEERLQRFPGEQVVLLDQKREFEVRRDEMIKLTNLPAWQAEELAARVTSSTDPFLFRSLVPAFQIVRQAQARLEQRIGLLRHVEALRIYAAEHEGKLPEKLQDVTVPLPVDPFTGKPFTYKLEGTTAHLRGTPPPGRSKVPGFNIHYEITIRK